MTIPSSAASPRRARKAIHRLLSTGCVMGLAISLAAIHQKGDAQTAFQGSGSLTSGDALIIQGSSANTDTIIVNSSSVIDWDVNIAAPTGNHDFLPAGSTVSFVDGLGLDYTVLNRINVRSGATPLLNQIIELNGTITSTLNGVQGGNVWFYTPGGFLIGGTSTINVGGLVLSTSQIDPASTFDGANGALSFTGLEAGAPTTSTVRIASGASISAGNYVVMVAPRIEQSGTVDANGNIVYVAGEAADITINNGLFDIVVSTGTGDANGIVHDGTTTGTASTGFTDRKTIFMAAVPKNQAMTMLLSGTIGYTPAASAFNDGSSVILSAGNDIQFGSFTTPSLGAGTGNANVAIGPSTLNNNTAVYALDAITLDAGQGESIKALSSLGLQTGDGTNPGTISVTASGSGAGAGTIDVAGDLYAGATGAAQGGTIAFVADGGDLTFTRVDAYANANGLSPQSGPGGDATGGTITLTARNGGTIGFGDASSLSVYAYGGYGSTGGNGTGGTIALLADGGTIAGTGTVYFDASGYAGYSDGISGLPGGNGSGGAISIATGPAGGSLSFGTLDIGADGNLIDPAETSPNIGNGGSGAGGTIAISLPSGTLTATEIAIHANGTGIPAAAQDGSFGSAPFQSGDGTGGTATFDLTGGSATITTLSMHADGNGGADESSSGFAPIASLAGNGTGGTVRFTGSSGSLITTSSSFTADGYGGGVLAYGGFGVDGANAGNGTGGTAIFALSGTASVTTTDLTVSASGFGAQGGTAYDAGSTPPPVSTFSAGNGGDGTGGNASLTLSGGALAASGTVKLAAAGSGGAGGENRTLGVGGTGGSGTGGTTTFTFSSEGHNIAALEIAAGGTGGAGGMGRYVTGFDPVTFQNIYAYDAGAGGAGGDGTGGSTQLAINNDPTLPSLTIDANGTGGIGGSGTIGGRGGDGFGGTGVTGAQLLLNASTLTVTGATNILSNGIGGTGGTGYIGLGGDGGDGFGGDASILAQNASTLTLFTLNILADGIGGTGGDGGAQGIDGIAGANGGGGTGGAALLRAESNATIVIGGDTVVRADGQGADGREGTAFSGLAATDGGNAGNGNGGAASLEAATGGSITQSTTAAFIQSASGIGGTGANGLGTDASGGTGGDATSGALFATLDSGGSFTVGNWAMTSIATAGTGGASTGAGTGGTDGTAGPGAGSGIFFSITDATIDGGAATLLSDSGIDFSASGTGTMALTGDFTATAADTISFSHASRPSTTGTTLSANSITLTAGGTISATGDTRLRAASSFSAESLLGGISLTDIGSGTDTTLLALNGDILVSTDLDAGGLVSADGTGITITSLTDIAFDHATANAGDFTLTASGTARFLGNATATNISITSGDIDVTSGAELFATGDMALTSSDTASVNHIGGTDMTGAYSLSAAEIARLVARNLTVTTPAQTIVGAFTVAAGTSAPISPDGRFTIDSAGRMRVDGGIGLTGLASTGGLTLRAGNGIDVVTDSASIDLRDGTGALGGTLLLESAGVAAATRAAMDDIYGVGVPITARNTRLAENDGIVSDDGALRAGSIGISVSEGVYIQNSGTSTDTDARRGFTANSLSITTQGAAEIVINGRLTDPNGTFATGLTALGLVGINGQTAPSSGYAAGSTINGCLIANPANCVAPLSPNDPTPNIPNRNEDIDGELNPDTGLPGGDGLPTVIIELKEFEQLGFPPLIDEPVTGSGNDDLWTGAGCTGMDGPACGASGQP